jgi:hypothetical protein
VGVIWQVRVRRFQQEMPYHSSPFNNNKVGHYYYKRKEKKK